MSRYWDMPVLASVAPVIERSEHVHTSQEAIERVAGWMAYEDFTFPAEPPADPFGAGLDTDQTIDLTLLVAALNFAFTDFETGIKFAVEERGRLWSDTEAMTLRIHQALERGVPLFDGGYLATVTREDLATVFAGNIEMPMLDERAEILNRIGSVLVDRYQGRFHRFVWSCAPAMYSGGDGLLERLVSEFPRFNDVSDYHGHRVLIFKLAQLCLWSLHLALPGRLAIRDLDAMTAFADYIVPVALRLMGILQYTPELEGRITRGDMIERDSDEEIEIRAHTLYATGLLTDAINRIRPRELSLVIPQLDYRLWKTYHATFWPHHLTRTVMY
jgi:hypothetical protein